MRKSLFIVALALSSFVPVLAQAPAPVPDPVEYNVSACGQKYSVYHITLDTDKDGNETFNIVYASFTPGELVKLDKPIVFKVTDSKNIPGGVVARKSIIADPRSDSDESDISFIYFTKDNRFIGLIHVKDDLNSAIYGFKGPVDEVFDKTDIGFTFCGQLQKLNKEDVPGVIIDWLLEKSQPQIETPDISVL